MQPHVLRDAENLDAWGPVAQKVVLISKHMVQVFRCSAGDAGYSPMFHRRFDNINYQGWLKPSYVSVKILIGTGLERKSFLSRRRQIKSLKTELIHVQADFLRSSSQ